MGWLGDYFATWTDDVDMTPPYHKPDMHPLRYRVIFYGRPHGTTVSFRPLTGVVAAYDDYNARAACRFQHEPLGPITAIPVTPDVDLEPITALTGR